MDGELLCALSQVWRVSSLLVLAVAQGMAFGWKAAVQSKLEDAKGPFDVTEDEDAWILSLFDLGVLGGVLLATGVFFQTGSRTRTLCPAPLLYAVWVLVTYAATDSRHLMVARTISGVAHGVLLLYAPIYIAEVTTPRLRGVLVTLTTLLSALGGLLSYLLATRLSLETHALTPLPFIAVALALMRFTLRETPYGLAALGHHDAAWDALRVVRRGASEDAVRREIESIRHGMTQQRRDAPSWRHTFSPPGTKLAAFLVIVLSGTTELIGLYTLLGARDYFYHESDSPVEYRQFNILFILVLVGGALVALALIEILGRRFLYGVSTFANFVAFAGLGGYYLVKEDFHDVDYTAIRWIPFASLMVFASGASLGVMPVPMVMIGELLNERAKVLVVLGAGLLVSISSFLINRLFLLVCSNSGFAVALILYAIGNLLNVMFTFDPMPETKGMTLVGIQNMLAEKERSFVLLNVAKKVFLR